MSLKGQVWKFGADVDTDVIIPARYLSSTDPEELAGHAMEGLMPDFPNRVKSGDVIVADKNFGCGSSREHAPLALKAAGVSCVIAKSFARIFYRNSFNLGLPLLESAEAAEGVSVGDALEVDLSSGRIKNLTTGAEYQARPIPPFMQELLDDGGLMQHVMKKVRAGGQGGG
jgi:3-isopropylmalate/(R)-2-methylmalate dehydratase small subunit